MLQDFSIDLRQVLSLVVGKNNSGKTSKGTEFYHVFLLMDNGNWTQYNYSHLMSGTPRGKSERPRERTNKLFYVCCTRAKEDLVMYFPNPQAGDLQKAREWFGDGNVIEINS